MKREELHILDYLEGRLTEDERAAIESELEQSPSLQKEMDRLRFLLNAVDDIKELHKVDTVGRWEKVSFKLSLLKFRSRAVRIFHILAAVAFLPLLVLLYWGIEERQKENSLTRELVEVKSAYGVISKVILPDSTLVYLNSGSILTYPRCFEDDKRSVSLRGEAYFIVSASLKKRFEVKLSDILSVNAYGTEFNINAYEGQEWFSAALVTGSISVNKIGTNSTYKIIQPGQLAVYDKKTEDIDVSNTNIYVATAWKDGKLVFRRAKMPEIIYRLSKHFNVDIELKDKILTEYEFSATFMTETLTEILNLMKKASPMRWYYIEPKQNDDGSYTKRKVIISLI